MANKHFWQKDLIAPHQRAAANRFAIVFWPAGVLVYLIVLLETLKSFRSGYIGYSDLLTDLALTILFIMVAFYHTLRTYRWLKKHNARGEPKQETVTIKSPIGQLRVTTESLPRRGT